MTLLHQPPDHLVHDQPAPAAPAAAAAPPQWRPVCAVRDLSHGAVLTLHVAGRPVAVVRTCDGEVFAVGPCGLGDRAGTAPGAGDPAVEGLGSWRDRPVVRVGGRRFELAGGRPVDGGAALPTYPVRVADGSVEVALPAA